MMNRVEMNEEMMNKVKANRQKLELNDVDFEEVSGTKGLWAKVQSAGSTMADIIKMLF